MAAYIKAQKLKSKHGRPILPNIELESSSRKSAVTLRLVETEKEVKSVAVANRVKQGVSEGEELIVNRLVLCLVDCICCIMTASPDYNTRLVCEWGRIFPDTMC